MRFMRRILIGAALGCVMGGPVWAKDFTATVVRQLQAQGYSQIQIGRTWLGRTQIVARKGGEKREVVLDPRNGEVLRDLVREDGTRGRDSERSGRSGSDDSGSGSGSGSGGSGGSSGGGSDDSDDDDDDDNSGSGHGGSGGGSGGGSDDSGGDDSGSDDSGGDDD